MLREYVLEIEWLGLCGFLVGLLLGLLIAKIYYLIRAKKLRQEIFDQEINRNYKNIYGDLED